VPPELSQSLVPSRRTHSGSIPPPTDKFLSPVSDLAGSWMVGGQL
jgi:hypothetical protein